MALPEFNAVGDLPPGTYPATMNEVVARFDVGGARRAICTQRLVRIYTLAQRTGLLHSMIIFGSYVTSKPEPNDVDAVLIMRDEFRLEDCPVECRALFDHATAQARYGASIFWVRPLLLINESMEDFVAYWQLKRDQSHRGIVEVSP